MCRRMGCLGRVKSSAGARLRGSSEHSVNGHGAMGLPGAGARDTLAFSSLAPRQPQAPRRGKFGSERLLLALGIKCFLVSWGFFGPDSRWLFCSMPAWFPWPLVQVGRRVHSQCTLSVQSLKTTRGGGWDTKEMNSRSPSSPTGSHHCIGEDCVIGLSPFF